MPAVVDQSACNRNWELCFAARVCPQHAFSLVAGDVVIDWALCGECAGPCTNFCDGYAIRYERDPDEFDILRRKTLGELDEKAAVEERLRLQEEQKAAAAAEQAALITDVSAATFAPEVLQSELPVIVDFWAPWCGPCRQMAPVFDELARQYQGLVKFVKVNIDEEPALAGQFRVQSIPTLIVFHAGRAINGAVGALPKAQLQTLVYNVLAATKQPEPVADAGTTP